MVNFIFNSSFRMEVEEEAEKAKHDKRNWSNIWPKAAERNEGLGNPETQLNQTVCVY